jgi:hypothetical protein
MKFLQYFFNYISNYSFLHFLLSSKTCSKIAAFLIKSTFLRLITNLAVSNAFLVICRKPEAPPQEKLVQNYVESQPKNICTNLTVPVLNMVLIPHLLSLPSSNHKTAVLF